MISLLDRPQRDVEDNAQALIKEARRLRQLRWLHAGAAFVVLAAGVSLWLSTRRGTPPPLKIVSVAVHFDSSARPLDGPSVVPKSAWAMTAGPAGSIYVVDQAREEVLRWSRGKGFFDVAGDGHQGFSGDGGPAIKASFNFTWASAVAVGRNGTLYISDSGNGRVRAVSPDGVVETVIGGGRMQLGSTPLRATDVDLGNAPQLAGLAIGPNGELYVGTMDGVYRLDGQSLIHVIGVSSSTFRWPSGADVDINTLPFRFADATRLAFDGRGDLIVGSDDTYSAYELTASGSRHYLGSIRGDASVAPLAEASDGDVVIGTGPSGYEWFGPNGRIVPMRWLGSSPSGRTPLDEALGGTRRDSFRGSDGVAVDASGDVFIDTDVGNTFTSVSAIVEVTPSGSVGAILAVVTAILIGVRDMARSLVGG